MISCYITPTTIGTLSFLLSPSLQYCHSMYHRIFTVFFLVCGCPPSVLDSCFFSCPLSTTDNAPDHFVSGLAHCRDLARLSTESCQNDRASRYDAAHRDVYFQTGDEVLLSTPLRALGLLKKFCPISLDPTKFFSVPRQRTI